MFTSGEFWNSFLVTFYYVIGVVFPILLFSLPVALMFNRPFRLREGFLAIWYIPVIIPLTVAAILWKLMFNPSFGLLTLITDPLGFKNLRWLNDPALAMPSLIIISIWRSFPYYMVIMLAGLGSIPISYTEAAKVDGASPIQNFLYITLPLLKNVLLYVSIVAVINSFQVFALPYLMTGGGPGSATRLLPYYIYQNAFEYLRMGYASSASLVLMLVLLALTIIQFRIFKDNE
jgi:ABC-type sugar transport system permease subunit